MRRHRSISMTFVWPSAIDEAVVDTDQIEKITVPYPEPRRRGLLGFNFEFDKELLWLDDCVLKIFLHVF